MQKTISILVGSGFSIPEGLPGVKDLNKRLSKIDESEILIHSDQTAIFLNGQTDNTRFMRADERRFLQDFLEYYSEKILESGEEFHYETFYDYYSEYLTSGKNKKQIEDFYDSFKKKYFNGKDTYRDCYNRISDFNRSFNQLLAELLHKTKYFEDGTTFNYPLYDSFVGFLRVLLKNSEVKFHTLNHDLFFDWLGKYHSSLGQFFCDGFQLEGSTFYGTLNHVFNYGTNDLIHKAYQVKLERFIGKYDKPLSFYKLHGSISNMIVHHKNERIRIKENYKISNFSVEEKDPKSGKMQFGFLHDEVAPDFLSGTTNKTRFYTKDPYYKKLFKHFKNNLSNSELLVVIGYGFQDSGINKYIKKHFLSAGKKMIVIDPYKPKTKLIDKYSATYVQKSVTELTYQEYLDLLPEHLKGE